MEYYGKAGEALSPEALRALGSLVHRRVRASVFTDRFEPQLERVGEVGTDDETGRLMLKHARFAPGYGALLADHQDCHTVMETLDDAEAVTVLTMGAEFPWIALESAVLSLAQAVAPDRAGGGKRHTREWGLWDGERFVHGERIFAPSPVDGRVAAFDGLRPQAEPLDRFFLSMAIHAPIAICVRVPRAEAFRRECGLGPPPA